MMEQSIGLIQLNLALPKSPREESPGKACNDIHHHPRDQSNQHLENRSLSVKIQIANTQIPTPIPPRSFTLDLSLSGILA